MAKGAPDHHLPLEEKLDDIVSQLQTVVTDIDTDIDESVLTLTDKLTVLITAVNNLKTTLTNLNIMPPVVETPWAVKNIGNAGISANWVNLYDPLEWETILDIVGSGQILSMVFRLDSPDDTGKLKSWLEITIDDIIIFEGTFEMLISPAAEETIIHLGLLGIGYATGDVYNVYYNVPLYYGTMAKVRWRNKSPTTIAIFSWTVSYTNLP